MVFNSGFKGLTWLWNTCLFVRENFDETHTGTYVTFPLVLSNSNNISKYTFCTSPQNAVRPTRTWTVWKRACYNELLARMGRISSAASMIDGRIDDVISCYTKASQFLLSGCYWWKKYVLCTNDLRNYHGFHDFVIITLCYRFICLAFLRFIYPSFLYFPF